MATTYIIIGITALTSFAAFDNIRLKQKLIFHPFTIGRGKDYYRFISSGLIHADLQHLAFNMITLFFFGLSAEENLLMYGGDFPRIKFWILYLGSMVLASSYSYFKHRENPGYMALGASGAVSGILFSYILFNPWGWLFIFFAIPIPAILFGIGYVYYSARMAREANDNIGHDAHLFGGIAGILLTLAFNPSEVVTQFLENIQHPTWPF